MSKLNNNISKKIIDFESIKKTISKDFILYAMLIIPILYFIIFKYIPMSGIILAFRKHVPGGSIFGVKWIGFKYFSLFLGDPKFWSVFKNTIQLSFWGIVIGYPVPVIFALLLNELRNRTAKRFIQTVSYLPKFFSTIIVYTFMYIMLSPSGGFINIILNKFGVDSIVFLNSEAWFRPIYILSDIWQYMGWNAILYIAALSGIDVQLYDAANIDGANRFKQTLHVTIPGIMPTIVVTFILSVGHMLTFGFEKVLLMYTPNIYDRADIIQTYAFRMGIEQSNYSFATAVGLFQAIASLIILWFTNKLATRYSDYSLW